MTRKDYQAIAKIFDAEISVRKDTTPGALAIKSVVYGLADIFARDNPRFDREKFYTACGI